MTRVVRCAWFVWLVWWGWLEGSPVLPVPAANAAAGAESDDFYGPAETAPAKSHEDSIEKGVHAVLDDLKALATAPLRMDRQDLLAAGGALALVGGAFALDHDIRTLERRNSTTTGQDLASSFGTLGSPGTLLGFNAGLIAVGVGWESYGGSASLKQTGLVSLEAEVFAVTATVGLKELIGRSRPSEGHGTSDFRPFSGDASFPSSHAAASFAVAAVIADRANPAVGWLAYGLATAVAASRVYADEHFTSDVVAGSLLGWGLGKLLSRLHPANDSQWEIRPVSMGLGVNGLAIGRRF